MKFLKAIELSKKSSLNKYNNNTIHIVSSINSNKLSIFLNAYSYNKETSINFKSNAFGTLIQTLNRLGSNSSHQLIILLFPWDILTIASWRDNPSKMDLEEDDICKGINSLFNKIELKNVINIHYFDFPFPNHQIDTDISQLTRIRILRQVTERNYFIHGPESFSLTSFMKIGDPFKQDSINNLSRFIHNDLEGKILFEKRIKRSCKIIFTDLDNTFWNGILAEDGYNYINSIEVENSLIYLHFRLLLRRLAKEGILIVAVSRNDFSYVNDAIESGILGFQKDLFTSIICGYYAKSMMIKDCLTQLNLNESDSIFIDDNIIEIKEVQNEFKDINLIHFSTDEDKFENAFKKIQILCNSKGISTEDRERVNHYNNLIKFKNDLDTITKENNSPNMLKEYLDELNMVLRINYLTEEIDVKRAIQLINKTSQFNSNGFRINQIEQASRVIGASLKDNSVDHGLILVCVISDKGVITNLAMSCRVFQRGVEHYFLNRLIMAKKAKAIETKKTYRNKPFRLFLEQNSMNKSMHCSTKLSHESLSNLVINLPTHLIKIESDI